MCLSLCQKKSAKECRHRSYHSGEREYPHQPVSQLFFLAVAVLKYIVDVPLQLEQLGGEASTIRSANRAPLVATSSASAHYHSVVVLSPVVPAPDPLRSRGRRSSPVILVILSSPVTAIAVLPVGAPLDSFSVEKTGQEDQQEVAASRIERESPCSRSSNRSRSTGQPCLVETLCLVALSPRLPSSSHVDDLSVRRSRFPSAPLFASFPSSAQLCALSSLK